MTTYWVDPLMNQQELDIAWNQQSMWGFLEEHYEADDEAEGGPEEEEEEWDFGDEPWDEGPQTPPFGPQMPRGRLVPVGGGLAVSIDDMQTEWEDAVSSLSSEDTP